jgi:glycosyltransferase involved in cell wall biosynthesis
MPMTIKTPRVSVLTPTYNRADLLTRSIDSVLSQTFNDFELIVIDDGSTDGTQELLAQYKDARLKVVTFGQNRGIGAARYQGVSQAAGEWVAFLDADDLWRPDKLASDISVLERYPEIDLLFDNYRNINYMDQVDQSGFDQTRLAFDKLKTTGLEPGVFRIDAGLAEALLTTNLIGTASIITVRRAVFDKVGNFNPALSGPEDFEFLWRAVLANVQFAYQTHVLVERHKDGESITARTRSFAPRLLGAFDLCEASLKDYGRDELLAPLNRARGRIWLGLLNACALEERRVESFKAFLQTMRYGASMQALLYLSAALAGPAAIKLVQQIRNK